jgi:hypothetical protein
MRATSLTLLPLTLWLLSGAATAATVYKWVDAQGTTHYSDQPHPDAKEIDVKPVNTVSTPPVAAPSNTQANASAPAGPNYTCDLIRPENDEVFLNTSTITARLAIQPRLAPGDQIWLAVDGKRVDGQSTSAMEFVVPNIERGTHTLMIAVYDRSGKQQLCTTPTVTFHVRQPSVQAPVKSTRPRF